MANRKYSLLDAIDKFLIVDYSEKSIAIPSDYDMIVTEEFTNIGGRFNSRLRFGAGWVFSKKKSLERLTHMFDAYGANYIHISIDDMETTDPGDKNRSDGPKITLLTNQEKRQAGICEKDMAMRLPGGEIISFSRESIKTEFCFGYSDCGQGPTNEEAHRECDNARTDPSYFMSENLERLDCIIDKLEHPDEGERRHLWIANWYTGDKNRWNLEFSDTPTDKPEWLNWREKELYDEGKMRPVTNEERTILIEFYKQARTARKKRCESYLKRYGLEKLRCWTYWVDA